MAIQKITSISPTLCIHIPIFANNIIGDNVQKEKTFTEISAVFLIGFLLYPALELLWRGYTHWTMALTGGICFLTLYIIFVENTHLPLWQKCLIGAIIITSIEFAVGCLVNLTLGWNVWNYSNIPGNILGQINPLHTLLWAFLSLPIVYLSNYINRTYFNGENEKSYLNQ